MDRCWKGEGRELSREGMEGCLGHCHVPDIPLAPDCRGIG